MAQTMPPEILQQLATVFLQNEPDAGLPANDEETAMYVRLLAFLAHNANADKPYIQILKNCQQNGEKLFTEMAKQLALDAQKALTDDDFSKIMHSVYDHYLVPSADDPDNVKFNLQLGAADGQKAMATLESSLAYSFSKLTPNQVKSVCQFITKFASTIHPQAGTALASLAQSSLSTLRAAGRLAPVLLTATFMTFQAACNIRRWWNGEISGKRCLKNVIDAVAWGGAGFGGGALGCVAGGFVFGPIGIVIGGAMGSLIGAEVMGRFSDYLTRKVFDLPQTEAAENAYCFLGVTNSSSSAEVNTAYRQLCLKYHPDKGGYAAISPPASLYGSYSLPSRGSTRGYSPLNSNVLKT